MSYHVDPTTLLFDALTDEEAADLSMVVMQLVLEGRPCHGHAAFLAWREANQFDDRQSLLVMSTAFPQRALVSLLLRVGRKAS